MIEVRIHYTNYSWKAFSLEYTNDASHILFAVNDRDRANRPVHKLF